LPPGKLGLPHVERCDSQGGPISAFVVECSVEPDRFQRIGIAG